MNKKRSNLLKLAFKNIFSYKWINFKICFAFACLAFLVCLFTIYNQALTARRKEALESAVSANYVYVYGNPDEEQQELIDTYLGDCPRLDFFTCSFTGRIFKLYGVKPSYFLSQYLAIGLDGELLTADTDDVKITTMGGNFFTPRDYTELNRRFGLDSMIIGDMPENPEQAILSEPLLNAFGLSIEDVMDKEVSLYVRGEEEPFYVGGVSGILRNEYFELVGHQTILVVGIILHEDHPLFENGEYRYSYLPNDWLDYETASVLRKANMTYAGAALVDWIEDLDRLQILANNLYYIIGSALIIALVLTVFLMVGKYIKVFSRTSGIFLTFGLSRRRLYGLLFLQLMLICLISIPLSFALTFAGYKVINAILIMMRDINMGVSFVRLIGMFGIGIFTVVATAAIFFIYAIIKLRGQTVKQFLSTEVR